MRLILLCLLLCLLAACSDPASQARDIGYPQLKADAQQMMKDCNREQGYMASVPKPLWPQSIKELKPLDVRNHMFGVLVITEKSDQSETGIYIVTYGDQTEMTKPSAGSGLSYEMITPGLHVASLKVQLAATGS